MCGNTQRGSLFGLCLGLDEKGVKGGFDGGESNLGACGNNVCLVDATKRDAVDLERSGNEQEPAIELFQADNSLALVAASEQDQDSSWCDGSAELGLCGRLARSLRLGNGVSGVEASGLCGSGINF